MAQISAAVVRMTVPAAVARGAAATVMRVGVAVDTIVAGVVRTVELATMPFGFCACAPQRTGKPVARLTYLCPLTERFAQISAAVVRITVPAATRGVVTVGATTRGVATVRIAPEPQSIG